MGHTAVSDTGPILHLYELGVPQGIKVEDACTTLQVLHELNTHNIVPQVPGFKADTETTSFFALKHTLDLGEASCIALCLQKQIPLLFTDDLDARSAAKAEGLQVHGTVGILLKAYMKKILTQKETLLALQNLRTKSSLFITQRLIDEAIAAVQSN